MGSVERCPKTLRQFQSDFATEEACEQYLATCRWPEGFICPRCTAAFGAKRYGGDLGLEANKRRIPSAERDHDRVRGMKATQQLAVIAVMLIRATFWATESSSTGPPVSNLARKPI